LLQTEANIQQQPANGSSILLKDILERKWSSVAKLKKEVDELAKQNKALKEQVLAGACERCGGGAPGMIG